MSFGKLSNIASEKLGARGSLEEERAEEKPLNGGDQDYVLVDETDNSSDLGSVSADFLGIDVVLTNIWRPQSVWHTVNKPSSPNKHVKGGKSYTILAPDSVELLFEQKRAMALLASPL